MATPGSGPETTEGKRASRKAESRKKKAKQRTGRLLDAAKEQARSALDNLKHRPASSSTRRSVWPSAPTRARAARHGAST